MADAISPLTTPESEYKSFSRLIFFLIANMAWQEDIENLQNQIKEIQAMPTSNKNRKPEFKTSESSSH